MSKYTTELRFICEEMSGLMESVGYYKVNEVIDKSRANIFSFDYPIFDENYKSVLERKILKHYYTQEIAFESVGTWLLKLDTKLNEIMPYYNQLYNSELIKFNPLYDVDVTRKHSREGKDIKNTIDKTTSNDSGNGTSNTKQTNSSNVTENNTNRQLYSDTPQGALTGVENEKYLTNATKNTENNNKQGSNNYNSDTKNNYTNTNTKNSTNNETINSTDEYLETVIGKQGTGSMSQMLIKYRETFLNIDKMIIDELSDLFMCLW